VVGARGIYGDLVRSFVKASRLRWLSIKVLVKVPGPIA
jgi:hypothetical protein